METNGNVIDLRKTCVAGTTHQINFKNGSLFTYSMPRKGLLFVSECVDNIELRAVDIAASERTVLVKNFHINIVIDCGLLIINKNDLILYSNFKYKTERYFELLTS
jgi:hypothetical protein